MNKHTPGPWEARQGEDAIHGDDGQWYVDAGPWCITEALACDAEAEPNARLIAQAPAYAEWAERWLGQYGAGWTPLMLAEAMLQLRAIHAKATGGQS
jgi:hypothetical protein